MKVTINTDEKTISPVYPATLSELAALEGLLSVRYGEGWTIVSEDFEEVTFPEIFCPNPCAPVPVAEKEWAPSPPSTPNTGTPLITSPFVITCGKGVEVAETFLGFDFTTTSARDWEAFNTSPV